MGALEKKRVDEGLKRTQLAKRLDVSDTFLTMVGNGKREPGVKLLRQIVTKYPDLQAEVLTYLRDSCFPEEVMAS